MLGNLHVRFGVGVGVKLHGLHHARRACVMLVARSRWSAATDTNGRQQPVT